VRELSLDRIAWTPPDSESQPAALISATGRPRPAAFRTVAMRRPGWTASRIEPSRSPRRSAQASRSVTANVIPQKRAGARLDPGVRDDLEDHLAEPEEPLAQEAVIGLDLADAAPADACVLERARGPLQLRGEDDEMVDVGYAVRVSCADRLACRRHGDGEAVDLVLPAGEPPAEDALARSEVQTNGPDTRPLGADCEAGAAPGGGIASYAELFDLRFHGLRDESRGE
jgi:hypothetical protein